MMTSSRIAISAALFVGVCGCGGTTPPSSTAEPTNTATTPTAALDDDPGLDTPAVRRLPRSADIVMRVHLGLVRGTPFEEVVQQRFPLDLPGPQRELSVDILSHTDTVTIGLGEQSVGWVFEGELGQRFDTVVELFSANAAPEVTGAAGQRVIGDERSVIGEVGADTLTLHMPATAAAETGDIPPAVQSPELEQLRAALPAVPADRAVLFEAWGAPTWGLLRETKLAVRLTYGAQSNDIHLDAALLYPDAELAAARATTWGEFWDGFVEESPESFDDESASVRSDGATVVVHHELSGLFGQPDADERAIGWALVSLAAYPPNMNFH